MARRRAELELRARRRLRRRLAPARLAEGRPGRPPGRLHGGDLAPPPVQLGRARQRRPVAPFWDALYAAGAELVVNGHDHDYERFAPQDPEGRVDPGGGIREFVVGTGGESLRLFNPPVANSELRESRSYGILVLDLAPGGYEWHFLGVAGRAFSDNGTGACH